ncbi:protein giant-lens [Aethina tumida]|uniref:protein giant-lens n=1 Tax=Aethina tumida TaxID=116153 RepID=UPI00096B0600|nr:protein giant-lens [Aethina tumida]
MYLESVIFVVLLSCTVSTRLPLEVFQHQPQEHHHHHRLHNTGNFHRKKVQEPSTMKILYQVGSSEEELPLCKAKSICNKVDLYDTPWIEKQCRCPNGRTCSTSLQYDDGFTFVEKTRQYKMCESVKKLPRCRFFRDTTWTITLHPNNTTDQVVHCHCPRNSLTYLVKRNVIHMPNDQLTFQYLFSCSPQMRLRCQRKEPCRLFTVRKRQEFLDEVNVNTLCQCPHAHRCPHHHTDYGVITSKTYDEDTIKTYTGYCLPS